MPGIFKISQDLVGFQLQPGERSSATSVQLLPGTKLKQRARKRKFIYELTYGHVYNHISIVYHQQKAPKPACH
jgi:hypothetical protein